ncbi:MAG: hemolysin family protein [Treponema sp.]|jgi:putative hemolysin|nr:hemolysin family protein [Treponema sp.]
MDDPLPALLLFVLGLASGFFSFAGAAMAQTRRPKLRLRADERITAPVLKTLEQPGAAVFSLKIWNLFIRLAAGSAAAGLFPGSALPLTLALLALFFLAASELLPRLMVQSDPEGALLAVFPLLRLCIFPWNLLYLLAAEFFVKKTALAGDEELLMALEEGEKTGAVESRERSMVEGVLYLGDRPVSAFMTHRSDIECLDIEAGIEEVREKALAFRSQGFFPVVRSTLDDIAGTVSVQDIFITLAGGWKGLSAIMKKPRFIPETLSALKAFEAFRREDENYLCVMDEYGGFAGSLRVRDLIEEIVGELTGSPPEDAVIRQADGAWLADGAVSIDELVKTPGLEELGKAQPQDYHTLAGFILKLAGEIPRTGASFLWENFRFTVVDLDGNRIDKVLISPASP